MDTKEIVDMCKGVLEHGLNEDERDVYLAYIALGSIHELAYKPEPSEPFILREFEDDKHSTKWQNMPKDKRYDVSKKFYSTIEIAEFFKEQDKTRTNNAANAWWLERYIEIWKEWDELEHAYKCWQIYDKYPKEVSLNSRYPRWIKCDYSRERHSRGEQPKTVPLPTADEVKFKKLMEESGLL